MSLAACSAQTPPVITAPQSETRRDTSSLDNIKTNTRIDNPQFSDVLEKYKTLNQRLLRLLAPLRLSNEHLCPKTERDPGFITHKLKDYPPHMRIMAQDVLGLSDKGIFIRSVRRGSPAHNAQIQEGDEVLAINGQIIANRPSPSKFYKALSRNAFNSEQTYMTLKPAQGPVYETSLRAQTACDMQGVVIFSEDINGQTDGEEI
ncbi:MAG: PDZ domain-containing protein, partial [Litorimonas sp.]